MGNQYFRTLDQARLKAQEVEERQQRQLELTTTQDRHTTQQRTEQSDSNEPSSSRQQGHQRSNRIPWKYNLLS
uniref:Uncharacterized protein n=1 Tax=Panagrolaimus davidi TaxID=227884 RepID=A0A914Q380_9BILA